MLALLAAARFAHFSALCVLFGLSAFPFYAPGEVIERRRLDRQLLIAAILAVLTGGLAFLAIVGGMGDTWQSAFDPAMIGAAATDTGIGRVWLARLALAAVTIAVCARRFPHRATLRVGASAVLLASVALTGHSAIPGGIIGELHQLADAVHLLAAGWWIGGLLAILQAWKRPELPALLRRFSRIGYVAVALLFGSGVMKTGILVSPISALATSSYGWTLMVKVGLFGAMLLLAASNGFQITPALAAGVDLRSWRKRLAIQVAIEFTLALLVVAVASLLGAMSPPVSQ